jgi:monovalent cation:H+ antiporter, CPA1 family
VLNAILFLIVGVAVPAQRLAGVAGQVAVAYAVMLVARAVPVYGLLAAAGSTPWSWRHVTLWGGVRGALSVALALSVAHQPGVDPKVAVLAYGMVILSLVVQGGLLRPVADLLRLRTSPVD